MKRELTTTFLSQIRPVFFNVGENIKRYEQVRGLFEHGHDALFAEPLVTGTPRDQITWYGGYPGAFQPLNELSGDERQRALTALQAQVSQLYRDLIRYVRRGPGQYDRAQYRTLRQSLDSFLEIPNLSNVLVFSTPEGPRVTLTNWGFSEDQPNADREVLRRLVSFGVSPVLLQAQYRGASTVAANEELRVEYEGRQQTLLTDASGQLRLEDVPLLSELTVYQVDAQGQRANVNPVLVDERDPAEPYPVWLQRLSYPMHFRVVDRRTGRDVPNRSVRLDYQNRQAALQASASAHLTLTDAPYGETVTCYDAGDLKTPLVQTHTHQRGQAEYLIPVQLPDPLKPVKKGISLLAFLLLLLALLLLGLVGYYFFFRDEKPILSQNDLLDEPKEEFVEKRVACNGGADGQNYISAKTRVVYAEYDLGRAQGNFLLDYYTDTYPDQIEVFAGPRSKLKANDQPLFTYFGSTVYDSGTIDALEQRIAFKTRIITVRVTGQSVWNYRVNCPR
jgi:hypothetical protein